MFHLLHARLLFCLLSSLFVSDWDAHASLPATAQSLEHECAARHVACVPRVVLTLRHHWQLERVSQVKTAPKHAERMLFHAVPVHETSPDDEDVFEQSVDEHTFFPAWTEHDVVLAAAPCLSTPATQLERPPRA